MKNNLQVKATWWMGKEKISVLYFDYYTKEGDFVGNVITDALGNLEWHILDANYKENILNTASFINGKEVNGMLEYVEKEVNPLRFVNARLFIANKGLVLNYRQNMSYSEEYKGSFIK